MHGASCTSDYNGDRRSVPIFIMWIFVVFFQREIIISVQEFDELDLNVRIWLRW